MLRAQEGEPLLDRTSDVEAGPALYGAHTPPAADAASTIREFLFSITIFLGTDPVLPLVDGVQQKKIRDTKFARRLRYYVPSTAWIPDYSLSLYVLALSSLHHFHFCSALVAMHLLAYRWLL